MPDLPRLLYLGNVPVEAGMGGSALLYRLLGEYPSDRLTIMQGREGNGFARLPGAKYQVMKPMRLLPRRWPELHGTALALRAYSAAPSIAKSTEAFRPQAVFTVTHGSEWISAWRVARRLGVPLHLICHDDWEMFLSVPNWLRGWTRSMFGTAYRHAASRLCVSPFMEAHYQRLYGAAGTVLYPSRARDVVPPEGPPEPRTSTAFTIAYAGSVHAAYAPALRALARALIPLGGKLLIFSQLTRPGASALELAAQNVEFEAVLPPVALIANLRRRADALFMVAMDEGLSSRLCFPSKLVDYTATGLPIVISAPTESAPAYWVREHPAAAVFIEAGDEGGLHRAVAALARDVPRRNALGALALQIGNLQFAYTRARDIFFAAIMRRH